MLCHKRLGRHYDGQVIDGPAVVAARFMASPFERIGAQGGQLGARRAANRVNGPFVVGARALKARPWSTIMDGVGVLASTG